MCQVICALTIECGSGFGQYAQRRVSRYPGEVLIRSKKVQVIADRKLSQKRVDSPNLDSFPTAGYLERCGINVIDQFRPNQWQAAEMIDKPVMLLRSAKSL
jgi:hypothetical protein